MATRECTRRAVDAYDKEHYKSVNVKFRVDDDADIIRDLQECKESGTPYRVFFSELYEGKSKDCYTRQQIVDTFADFRGVMTKEMVERMLDNIE